jgi:hypothetical protein
MLMRRTAIAIVASGALLGEHAPHGCGSDESRAGSDGGCPKLALPDGVPTGWEEWNGYACGCRLFVPGTNGAPPDPITWETCPSPGPTTPSCRRMTTPWTKRALASVTVFPQFSFDKDAHKVIVEFGRIYYNDDRNVRYHIVAEADGPVHQSFLAVHPANTRCELLDHGLADGKYAFSVLGDGQDLERGEGVLAGTSGELYPSVVLNLEQDPNSHRDWKVGRDWLIETRGTVQARDWATLKPTPVYDPALDPDHLAAHNVRGVRDSLFFEVDGGGFLGVMAWSPASGLQPLIRYFGDSSQGAGNFNTDGVDMVWTHGSGKASGLEYPVRDVMTAPFTVKGEAVKSKARRLRSDPGNLTPLPYGIGCGYAARNVEAYVDGSTDYTSKLFVVRLADGVAWIVDSPLSSSGFHFNQALGISCEEIFASAQFKDEANTLVRIRLDSLGPGIPPD